MKMHGEFDESTIFPEYIRTKDKKLKNEIIDRYLYIAEIMSKRFANRGIDYEDIYQVACLGLVLAVDRFRPDMGVKFASFATPTVTGEIKRYFRDKGCFVKIPRKLYEVFTKAEKLRQAPDSGHYTQEEIARHLDVSVETVRKAYEVGDMAFIRSLEQEAYGDGGSLSYETLGSDDKNFLLIENEDFMKSCMEALSEREREFVRLRYYEEKNQREISELWQENQMYVSRFEKSLLKKLRAMFNR